MITYTFAEAFEDTVKCLQEAAAIPDCDWVHDRRQISKCMAKRRVIWIATGGVNSRDDVPGGSFDHVAGNKSVKLSLLYKDLLTIECHIAAESLLDVETIRRGILASAYAESKGGTGTSELTPGAYRYPQQADGQASDLYGGRQNCIQNFTLKTYIPGPHSELVTVTSVTHACEFTE